ncbi:hypothetical protein EOM81_01740 [bacterium]|nr:hypothetical protein [bacterium]
MKKSYLELIKDGDYQTAASMLFAAIHNDIEVTAMLSAEQANGETLYMSMFLKELIELAECGLNAIDKYEKKCKEE